MKPARLVTAFVVSTLLMAVPASAQEGDPVRGRAVFEANCAMCHGDDAAGMMGMHPSLRGAIERLTFEGVEVTVHNGRDTDPPMPAFEGRLSDAEISDVIAYLATLRVGPRNFGGDGSMMDMDGMMGGGMWAWMALFLVIVAAVVVAAALVARAIWRRGDGGERRSQSVALDILKERYARGEIDRDEFEERRRVITS
ncbi:MAG: c-type cytochrome [Actinomycetota bacterium]|nr:c-type cytochrome [Actinomycetota bacterium]